ncbi:Glycoside hydrolase, family 28 [Dillenia turbinata]|uniref:Glycoside hydrolase, family 28 n=1 Tax=Dillenia turbinata TaxID=194707 RepID=A0AAN8ZD11_9MAGN
MAKFMPLSLNFLITFLILLQSANAAYNVVSFGAKPDGHTDSTPSFLEAWTMACSSVHPATLYVPHGTFLVKTAVFSGPCKFKVTVIITGTLVAPSNYQVIGQTGFWIKFINVSGLSIYGGTLNAMGTSFWACRTTGSNCPTGSRSLSILSSTNVLLSGLTSINSQTEHIGIDLCSNVLIRNLKAFASSQSLNTDGIHVQSSTGITIIGSVIRTGDDCISIGPGNRNVWIQQTACGPGHGISIGSLGNNANEDGVQNVTVTGAVFTGTLNGVRIKSWGRQSNGFARSITFQNIVMKDVYNPIIIDQKYCPSGKNCPNQNSGVKISQVTYSNIKGTSSKQEAVTFNCSPSNPCTGITMKQIHITFQNKATTSSCHYAGGTSSGVLIPASCL